MIHRTFLALAGAASLLAVGAATGAAAATPLTVTYQGTLSGFNSTYNTPFEVSVILSGVTTQEDAADGQFSYSSFTADYSGDVSSFSNVTAGFVGSVFRISVNGTTFADFTFTGGFPNFSTGADYAVTLAAGSPITGYYGTAAVTGGAGFVRGDLGDVAAVPEPASWAMMLGGFGLVGGAMRRRSAKVTFA